MGKVESNHEMPAKLPHHRGWHHELSEPEAEAPQGFAHELEHQADMGAIWALVLKIIDKMAHVLVTSKLAISITKMPENFPLEYGLVLTVGFRTENLEGSIFVLIFGAAKLG
jgi:hypothetical protein